MLRALVRARDTADKMRQRAVDGLLIEQPRSVIASLLLCPCGHGRSKTVHGDLAPAIIKPSGITITLQSSKSEMDALRPMH
jgi:hypothetical protein